MKLLLVNAFIRSKKNENQFMHMEKAILQVLLAL